MLEAKTALYTMELNINSIKYTKRLKDVLYTLLFRNAHALHI